MTKNNFLRGFEAGEPRISGFFKLQKIRTNKKLVFHHRPKIIVILGQTATGKSSLAVKIAKKLNGEIVSADSRQVYKYLNIGTGKITKKEMRGVPHHLLDFAHPKNKFTVAEHQKQAISAIADILKRGKTPIICGGTGFYIDAITKGIVFPEVPPNNKLRKSLEKRSAPKLFKILKKLDKARAENIDQKNEQNNKVRLIRAIEIAKYLGKVPKIKKIKPKYEFIQVGLKITAEELNKNINKRVDAMFKAGLLKEIQRLKKFGITDKRLREFGFEYNKPDKEPVKLKTLQYAKRQNTWFKREKNIKWFNPKEYKSIETYISRELNG
ncbi:MAG: tRNA (adenosine(37)-N6)-dimethylallyltransferase MiaA [Candidatus Paceibacterota bacterium]|jgi:tRNA dimethylallyltransferase